MNTPQRSPLRVLYIARAPFISGAERALLSMLRHLDRSQIQPHLVVGTQTPLIDQARQLGIDVSLIPLAQRSKSTWLLWRRSVKKLKKLTHQFAPHLLHANDVPSCQAISAVGEKLGIPRVIHVRWVISAQEMAWWAYRGTEAVICISQWVRDQLGDPRNTPLASAQFEVVPDCVDWPASDPILPPDQPSQSPLSTNRPDNTPALGFAGQLIESKGLDLVIQALGHTAPNRRPRLLIAGEDTQTGGAYRQRLQSLAQECGVADHITWLGFLDDVSTLYRQVDAMICPSKIEPLGLVPLEAARFKLPTLANRVGGLTETIVHNHTGLLIEPSIDGWTQAFNQLPDRPQLTRMGLAAHHRTRQFFSPAVYQQKLVKLYSYLTTPHAAVHGYANPPAC